MKRTNFQHPPATRGFTLIEILIIAALIALFSSLAIVSAQFLVDQSKRKATIADVRTLAHCLAMAHFDHAMFPKLGYLSMSRAQVEDAGGLLQPDFDAMGNLATAVQQGPYAKRILDNWNGPYVPSSGQRKIAPVGYTVRMEMPNLDAAGQPVIVDWPADPWGNPYVVYLVKRKSATEISFVSSPNDEPDEFAAVVSYGKNRIPGGPSDVGAVTPDIREQAQNYMLFKKKGDHFVALTPEQYEQDNSGNLNFFRVGALTKELGYLAGYPNIPGIMDPQSDDIFMAIP